MLNFISNREFKCVHAHIHTLFVTRKQENFKKEEVIDNGKDQETDGRD